MVHPQIRSSKHAGGGFLILGGGAKMFTHSRPQAELLKKALQAKWAGRISREESWALTSRIFLGRR